MSSSDEQPRLTEQGVAFTVRVEFEPHDCVISLEALARLSALRSTAASPLQTFAAYEARINGVARRMVAARVQGNPLLIGPNSFQ